MKKYEKISIAFKEVKISDILLNGVIGIDKVISGYEGYTEDDFTLDE